MPKSITKVQKIKMILARMLAVFVAFCVWVYQQPTEFDEYVQAQKDFLDDLYSGALLNDMSQQDIENIDRVIPLEELLQMVLLLFK